MSVYNVSTQREIRPRTGLPFLREASEGVKQTYKVNQQATPTREKLLDANAEYERAISYNRGVADDLIKRPQTATNMSFRNVKQGFMRNGNPLLKGGIAEVMLPTDTMGGSRGLRIPNQLAQQVMYQSAWNQGRWDMREQFGIAPYQLASMGVSGSQPMYFDWAVAQEKIDRMAAGMPGYMNKDGRISRNDAVGMMDENNARIRQLEASMPVIRKEYANAGGVYSDNYSHITKQIAELGRQNYELNQWNGSSTGFDLGKWQVSPSIANVYFNERVVK